MVGETDTNTATATNAIISPTSTTATVLTTFNTDYNDGLTTGKVQVRLMVMQE